MLGGSASALPHHSEAFPHFFAFFLAADFLVFTGDFLAAFFFFAGMVNDLSLSEQRGRRDAAERGAFDVAVHHKRV